jgi:hypothetical protein
VTRERLESGWKGDGERLVGRWRAALRFSSYKVF